MGHRDGRPLGKVVRSAASGSEDAWTVLHDLLRPYIASLVPRSLPRRVRARLDPEDVVREAFRRMFLDLGRLEYRDSGRFLGWVRQVTRRALSDEIRRHERVQRSVLREEPFEAGAPDLGARRELESLDRRIDVSAKLHLLPESERCVLRLHHIEGRQWKEVASVLRRSPRACRNLDAMARGHLARALSAYSPERERVRLHLMHERQPAPGLARVARPGCQGPGRRRRPRVRSRPRHDLARELREPGMRPMTRPDRTYRVRVRRVAVRGLDGMPIIATWCIPVHRRRGF